MKKLVRLYITRHGQTEHNVEYRAQGWSDSPLTASGREVASRLGVGLREISFDKIYSSSAKRACDTAQIVRDNMGVDLIIHTDDDLRERGLGKLEGRVLGDTAWTRAREAAERAGKSGCIDLDALDEGYQNVVPQGSQIDRPYGLEDFDEFRARLKRGLDSICEQAADGESNVLVVSHGMAILGMISAITGEKYAQGFIENASITLIENIDGVYHIKRVNDMGYITSN